MGYGQRAAGVDAPAARVFLVLRQRVRKSGPAVPGGQTDFVYDEQGRLLGEYDANGKVMQETVYLDDLPVAVLKPEPGTGRTAVYQVYADQLNTPRVITRATDNQIVWRWDTGDPFGLFVPDENPGGLGVFTYNLRFPGQYFDKETNLFYNGHRDYDPQTGRYIESDPIGLAGGLNPYVYVLNQPTRYVDPLGLNPVGGAVIGAEVGTTFLPGVGTVVGGVVGAGVGAWIGWNVVGPIFSEGEKPPRGLPPEGIKPPIPDADQCTPGPASRPGERNKGGQSTWDPRGGEWRWYPGDRWHNPHWDYNPHNSPSSPWENIPHGDLPPVKPVPDPKK